MTLTLVTPPSVRPFTLAELGDHLRLTSGFGSGVDAGSGGPDDAALTRALDASVAVVERATSMALLRQTWDWSLKSWRDASWDSAAVAFPLAPVLAVQSITLVGADGSTSTWPSDAWRLDLDSPRPSLRALSGARPSIPWGGALRVRFEAGFGDQPSDTPADLGQAVLLLAAHFYERRHAAEEERQTTIPNGVATLLAPYRTTRI